MASLGLLPDVSPMSSNSSPMASPKSTPATSSGTGDEHGHLSPGHVLVRRIRRAVTGAVGDPVVRDAVDGIAEGVIVRHIGEHVVAEWRRPRMLDRSLALLSALSSTAAPAGVAPTARSDATKAPAASTAPTRALLARTAQPPVELRPRPSLPALRLGPAPPSQTRRTLTALVRDHKHRVVEPTCTPWRIVLAVRARSSEGQAQAAWVLPSPSPAPCWGGGGILR